MSLVLSERQEHLLYEIYGISYSATTISLGEGGLSMLPPLTELARSPKEQLRAAILEINLDSFKVERVGEILAEYEEIGLDPSPINREGYSFKLGRTMQTLRHRLYTYTGIRPVDGGGSHRIKVG